MPRISLDSLATSKTLTPQNGRRGHFSVTHPHRQNDENLQTDMTFRRNDRSIMATADLGSGDAPIKKSKACVPCHERKVRCNATRVGLPCTRCVKRNETQCCAWLISPEKAARSSRSLTLPLAWANRLIDLESANLLTSRTTTDRSTRLHPAAVHHRWPY